VTTCAISASCHADVRICINIIASLHHFGYK
jgi:hypothetical protein